MRAAAVAVALAAAAVAGAPTRVGACSCALETPARYLGRADAAFVGTVSDVRAGVRIRVAVFDVNAIYKGPVGRATAVETDPLSSCAVDFAEGTRYLVFADEKAGRLGAGLCGGTTEDTAALDRAGVRPVRVFDDASPPAAAGDTTAPLPIEPSRATPIGVAAALAALAALALTRLRPRRGSSG